MRLSIRNNSDVVVWCTCLAQVRFPGRLERGQWDYDWLGKVKVGDTKGIARIWKEHNDRVVA